MREFIISKSIKIVCKTVDTRSGFAHIATLFVNGQERESARASYQNRTWESYEYQSVMQKLVSQSKTLNEATKKDLMKWLEEDHTDWSGFRRVAAIAQMGEMFGASKKESNDWKSRMLKAGISGVNMPEDWDTLSEAEKEQRLNNAINELRKH